MVPAKLDTITPTFGTVWFGISRRREQLKTFQNREIVIAVLSQDDFEAVATGTNLVQLLRNRNERAD